VLDSLLIEVPIIGFFTGLIANPKYKICRPGGTIVCLLKKTPSMWGRKFTLSNEVAFEHGEEDRILLGVMMMVLLERRRG
jgi:hypothetical protein